MSYRSIQYEKLLRGIASLAGIEWDELDRVLMRTWIENIFDRTVEVWTDYNWPDLIVVEPRVIQYDDWEGTLLVHADSATLYNANGTSYAPSAVAAMIIDYGTKVYYDGKATAAVFANYAAGWYTVIDGGLGGTGAPLSTVLAAPDDYLSALTTAPAAKILRFNQAWKFLPVSYSTYFTPYWRELNDVLGVYKDDPRASKRPRPVAFEVSSDDGVTLAPDAPALVWVRHRVKADQFYGELWDSAVAASPGYGGTAVVYHEDTGEFYRSTKAINTTVPSASTSDWAVQAFPECLFRYVKFAAFSDHLTAQGEFERADKMLRKAEGYIEKDWHQLAKQNYPRPRVQVVTRRR